MPLSNDASLLGQFMGGNVLENIDGSRMRKPDLAAAMGWDLPRLVDAYNELLAAGQVNDPVED